MTDEPQPIGGRPLDEARERLDAAHARHAQESRPRVSPDPDLDDDGTMAEMRERAVAEQRLHVWSTICPQRFHGATLSMLAPPVRQQIECWRRLHPRPNLVLLGPVGTGKTYAALAAVREDYLDRALEVLFLPVVECLDLLRPGGPEGAMDDLLDVPRLVLDDLGTERPTDWTAERLGALVNRRWMEERPIIATANLDASVDEATGIRPLMAALGERTYSRLVGDGAVVIRMAGEDRRRG